MQQIFHIRFGNARTTISVDTILSQLMAIKLKCEPDSVEAHRALRVWLQERLLKGLGASRSRKAASQWARRYMIEEILDKKISTKWVDWLISKGDE